MPKTAAEWNDAIASRRKALKKDWLDKADEIVDIYECEEGDKVPFNILYSNTETMLPAMYNSTPRPDVSRRYTSINMDKQLDTACAMSSERLLEYFADSNDQEYEDFGAATQFAVLQALVPGQGQVRVRYKSEGNYQHICYDSVIYDRFVWAYARKWCDCPWVAFGVDLIKEDFEAQFPDFCKKKVYKDFDWQLLERQGMENTNRRDRDDDKTSPTLLIWEIWNAPTREIKFVCTQFKEDYLKEDSFPFQLTSRFPCPEPLKFIRRAKDLTPKPPYVLYERQAQELNEITNRLKSIVKAIKWRGAYNGAMKEMAQVFEQEDTGFVPIEDIGSFMEQGGLEKGIWTIPLDILINTARELSMQRDAVKGTIYEIMGIGDILRGESKPSETAAAQEIKNQWGTLRIKRMQRDVQNFCRDLFRISLEFASNLFTPATFAAITKLPYPTNQQKQQAAMALQQKQMAMQQQQQMAAQQAQAQGQPPPPPQQPQLSSADQMMMEAAQSVTWEQIVAVMRDKFERTYRIDIETNSTVDLEATEDKAAIAEFMNAWGQMMSGIVPLVQTGAMPFEVAKIIMGEIFRRFRFAHRVEQALDLIEQPRPPQDPKVLQAQHDAEKATLSANGARQLEVLQKQIVTQQGTIEKQRVELAQHASSQDQAQKSLDMAQRGAQLDNRETALSNKEQQHALKTDYAGKVQLAQQQVYNVNHAMRKQELTQAQKDAQAASQSGVKDVSHASALFNKDQQNAKAVEQTKAQGEKAAAADEKPVMQGIDKMAQSQSAMMDTLSKILQIVSADRESEIKVGPDGTKKARSRVVMH